MRPSAPWTTLHARLHQTLRKRQLLSKQQRVLIGLSGGQDSLCLTQLLIDLQSRWEWELAIAHCDHRWRSDSQANATYVATLAEQWGLPFHLLTAETPPASEAAARDWRYGALADLAATTGFPAVVTGHTASDCAETLLYNLLRGSGMDGLQALTWKRSLRAGIEIVRPLLDMTRQETGKFCQQRGLQVWQDETNTNLRYTRNRIRLELLPYLQQVFNPNVESLLAQTSELLRADVDCLEALAAQWLHRATQSFPEPPPDASNWGSFHRKTLWEAPLALQRRAVRQFLQGQLGILPNFDQVEKLTALITAPNRSQTDPFPCPATPAGIIARVEGDWILLVESAS
jgi:tRNA(Ile)-lysidine synthase